MTASLGLYSTGTISVTQGQTTVTGLGTLWAATGVINEFDALIATDGNQLGWCFIDEVTSHTELELKMPWNGATLAGATYFIIRFPAGWIRTDANVAELLSFLDQQGLLYNFTGDQPDDSVGEDGQHAYKLVGSPVQFNFWTKTAGVWVEDGTFGASDGRYDIIVDDPGRPGDGEVIARVVCAKAFGFSAGLTLSRGIAAVAATAEAVFSLQKNAVEFGTATFAAAGSTVSFASASGATFAVGDVFTVVAPNPRDDTLKGIAMTVVATRL